MTSPSSLLDECRAGLALLVRVMAPLESLGEARELLPLRDGLMAQLGRDDVGVELRGEARLTLEALLGERLPGSEPALTTLTLRVRRAAGLDYHARWDDGTIETLPPDCSDELAVQLARAERALQATGAPPERIEDSGSIAIDVVHPETALVPVPPPRGFFGWLRALFRRWFGRRRPADPDITRPVPTLLSDFSATTSPIDVYGAGLQASEAARADVERRRHELESYRELRHRRALQRIAELLAGNGTAPPVELIVGARDVPAGLALLLVPATADARADSGATVLVARAAASDPQARADLFAQLERIGREQPAAIAQRLAGGLRACREHLVTLDERARGRYQERVAALRARTVDDGGPRHKSVLAGAQLPMARGADQLVHDMVQRLEVVLRELRADWTARIDGCAAVEQLRTEVAAIEDGAAKRLSILFDELREAIAVGSTRLVLELARPLRQDLLQARATLAGEDVSPKVEETFAGLRGVLPASLEAAFGELSAPGLGSLLQEQHGLFDPLFPNRTLARDKRDCLARLGARLDEIERTTTRELFAAAVYLCPLLIDALSHVLGEVLAGHGRWLDERIDAEQVRYEEQHATYLPALALVSTLEETETRLLAQLDAAGQSARRQLA
jgi:hypothetical protein